MNNLLYQIHRPGASAFTVVPAHAEFLVLGLGLSELQYLVDEVQ